MALSRELARKLLHLAFAAVPIALASGFPAARAAQALAAMLVLAIALEIARRRAAVVDTLFTRSVGPLLRESERRDHWTGATWLLAALGAAVWLLPVQDAIAVTWAASVGDASAALIGIVLGGRLLPRPASGPLARGPSLSGKSFEGSAACFVATFAGAYGLAALSAPLALAVAAAGTAAEWPRSAIDDNVRVVAATAAVLILASRLTGHV